LCAKYGRLKDFVIQFNFGLLQKVLHQIKALITMISKMFEPVFYVNCSVFYYCLTVTLLAYTINSVSLLFGNA